jgi:hypothetical protein
MVCAPLGPHPLHGVRDAEHEAIEDAARVALAGFVRYRFRDSTVGVHVASWSTTRAMRSMSRRVTPARGERDRTAPRSLNVRA